MAEKQNKRSQVWKYFNVVEAGDKKKAKCTLCAVEVSYTGGSTGAMSNHLKHVHKSLNTEQAAATVSKTVQPPITAFRTPVVSTMSKLKWQSCTEKLANMCARDLRPMSIVEGDGFKTFCHELNPSYNVPSKQTISKYVSISYDKMKADLIQCIAAQTGISLTCDHWTSLATEGFLTVTGHFIDQNWEFQNCVLATRKTTERHTGENIASDIMNICSEFGIKASLVASLVTDNASNMVSCASHLPESFTHVRCFGHTLQLSIRGAFDKIPSITRTIGAAKHIVNHFRRSVNVNTELHIRQRQMGIPENSLILDCPTRWNSTYDMFLRLLEQRLAVYAVLHDPKITKPADARILDMTDDQWTIIEGMIPVLKPLYMATRLMCSEEYPTLSGTYPVLFSLINYHLSENDKDSTAVSAFKKHVSDDLQRRYFMKDSDTLCTSLPIVCSFLDPRYRSLPFLTEVQRARVHDHVLSILQTSHSSTENTSINPNCTATESQTTDVPNADSSTERNQVFSCKRSKLSQDDVSFLLGGYFDTQDCDVVVPSTLAEELDMYSKEKPVSTKVNPFDWWKVSCVNFPKLAALVRRVLCSPATSVPSERVFSTAGGTVTKLRAALDSESIDKLIFLNKRLKFFAKQKSASATHVVVKAEPKSPIKVEPRDEASPSINNNALPPLPQLPDLPFSL